MPEGTRTKQWKLSTSDPALDRRDFLRAAGFTFASAALSSCARAPVEKAIPFLVQPEGLVPGRSYFYTSTCDGCSAGCGLLVKARDGRPVKLEGNPRHPLSRGGLCAVGQASILGAYDSLRFTAPQVDAKPASWADLDRAVAAGIEAARGAGTAVRVLTGTIISPTLRAAIDRFLQTVPDGRHIIYDPLSNSAILDAHESTHGVRALPRPRFERADVIVGIDADFLGTWIAPVQFGQAYRDGRTPDATPRRFSYHAQLESRMSLTGSKADRRIRVAPEEMGAVLTGLAVRLARLAGASPLVQEAEGIANIGPALDDLANRLWEARGRSVVVCGVQDLQTQVLCNYLNHLAGAYGATLDFERPTLQVQGQDRELERFVAELGEGKVGALFVHGVNPAYDLPRTESLANALRRVPLFVSLAQRPDETATVARLVAPASHALESWGDAEPVAGTLSVQQPALAPLFQTRPASESFSVWSGVTKSAYDLVREHWEGAVFPRQTAVSAFPQFWDQALKQGFVEIDAAPVVAKPFNESAVRAVGRGSRTEAEFSLVLYPTIGMADGRHAYNAWLQELPDPVTKVTWDNYACFSVAAAARLAIRNGDVIRLDVQGPQPSSIELPAFVQPGQHDGVVAVALGYGSALSTRFSTIAPKWLNAQSSVGEDGRVGINAAPLLDLRNGVLSGTGRSVRVTKTAKVHELASTQEHFRMNAADTPGSDPLAVVRETTLAALDRDQASPPAGAEPHEDLWPADHEYPGRRWGMVIDLSSCTGCSACVIACQAENNVPVVGKDEVRRSREMHWIRLDRYYQGEGDGVDVAVQPMLCQHCENAPCETVCPVDATLHNSEGLNVQVYNRCVGTRFCENNCPYKVRRFNWFDYARDDRLANLALNPDITVRSRGVMEKCSFCSQRIQEAEIESKYRDETVADGQVQTACQQSCPSRAIVFGDLNDPASEVSKWRQSGRRFGVLEELNVRPSVSYLSVVRNRQVG